MIWSLGVPRRLSQSRALDSIVRCLVDSGRTPDVTLLSKDDRACLRGVGTSHQAGGATVLVPYLYRMFIRISLIERVNSTNRQSNSSHDCTTAARGTTVPVPVLYSTRIACDCRDLFCTVLCDDDDRRSLSLGGYIVTRFRAHTLNRHAYTRAKQTGDGSAHRGT